MSRSVASAIASVLALAPQRTARPGEINFAFVDPYSLLHAMVGGILALLGLRLGWLLLIAIGWEVAEHVLKNLVPALFPHATQDTLANSTGDVLAAVGGWFAARRFATRAQHSS